MPEMSAKAVLASIEARKALTGISNPEIAVRLRMSLRTWQRRLQHPETLTVGELEKLDKILGVMK